jgi:eukaryotic-like serine/threonine-protein kinase
VSSSRPIRLGSFELFAPIARGGMGEVWRGRHVRQGVSVAVKVMTAEATRREDYLLDFRNEVRSVARLDHPGIVMVFDHGEVDSAAHEATRGRLVAGSPYFAMELASGGLRDLMRRQRAFPWPLLKVILLAVLDALGHAHARGVIHRDLKPHNVLQFKSGTLKLSDFGIAHVEGRETVHRIIGTPAYMSPEQLMRHWRDYGPWTDLYALGVMAFQLASGSLPFRGSGPVLQRAHLYDEPPPLKPRAPVPDGFYAWVARLLEKQPRARFLRAADAAWALEDLGDPTEEALTPSDHALALSMSREVSTFSFSASTLTAGGLGDEERSPATSRVSSFTLPDIPQSWRKRQPPGLAPQHLDAGLGLFPLRSFRLVGRERERDALWRALCQVRSSGSARLCMVHGVAGIGKSRLVEWTVDRAHEVGAATILTCQHDSNDDAWEAIRHMLSRFLSTQKLARPSLRLRLRQVLTGWDETAVEALVELLFPAPEEREVSVRLQHPFERFAVVESLLRWLCLERPVILVLEDVHWGRESLGLAEYLLKRQAAHPLPVLLLLTATDDGVSKNSRAAQRLQDLLSRGMTRRVSVAPLDKGERAELVRELLGLEDTLAAQVEDRTAGNPAFTIQLVGDWVERGVLKVGAHGFTLKEGEGSLLPENLREVAQARVSRILDGLPPKALSFLERASVLGRDVDEDEWQVACDCDVPSDWTYDGSAVTFSPDGARLRARLVDRLLSQHLVEETDCGWSFVQGAFRESLVLSAQQEGRWKVHHLVCAAVLRHRQDVEVTAERIGRHLLAAGEDEAALELLMESTRSLRRTSSYREALGLIGLCEAALKRLDLDGTEPRWGELMLQRVAIQRLQGDLSEAMLWANRLVLLVQRHEWTALLPSSLIEKATVAVLQRELDLAETLLEQALLVTTELLERARCLRILSQVFAGRGDEERAISLLSEARRGFAAAADDFGQAECWREMAPYEETRRGVSLLRRAMEIYQRLGMRSGIAQCVNGIADVQRRSGDLDAAEAGYRESIALFDALGGRDSSGVYPRINLGLLCLERENLVTASDLFEDARAALVRSGQTSLLAGVNVALMATAGARRDWQSWDRCAGAATTLLRRTRFRHPDVAWTALVAGRKAMESSDHTRAAMAFRIAVDQYEGLGLQEGLDEVGRLLEGIEAP